MSKVKAVCGSLGALGGGTLATAITFALIPVASVGAELVQLPVEKLVL